MTLPSCGEPKPVIGLVGAIGAGKSTAARCLARRGGAVIDADAIGHAVLELPAVKRGILERWGRRGPLLKPDGKLDRRSIAAVVFGDPAERAALEGMVFPAIREQAAAEIAAARNNPAVRFVVLDAAVMLEAGWDSVCDRLIYVDAPRDLRLSRVAARSGWAAADLDAREAAQMPAAEKMRRADAVVVNDGPPEALQEAVDELLGRWGLTARTEG